MMVTRIIICVTTKTMITCHEKIYCLCFLNFLTSATDKLSIYIYIIINENVLNNKKIPPA